jgi:CheY-like chemotaxis protein
MANGESRSLSVLLVDDHKDSLDLLARLLRRCGHAVETATRVEDALRAIGGRRFDLLVSDIGLPDGSGTEVMRAFRAEQGSPGIALTGHGEDHYARACEEAGFAARLLKPVVFDRLVNAMESVLPAEVPKPIC